MQKVRVLYPLWKTFGMYVLLTVQDMCLFVGECRPRQIPFTVVAALLEKTLTGVSFGGKAHAESTSTLA